MNLRPVPSLLIAALLAAALPVAAQQGTATGSGATAPGSSEGSGAATHKKKSTHAESESAGLKSEASYTIGVTMGQQLKGLGLTDADLSSARIAQGLRDALSGKAKATQADQQKVMMLIRQSRDTMAAKNETAAQKFLAEKTKEPGVQTLPSGLAYKVMSPGSGESPKPTDHVTVNYRGTLLDGTEFDSSYKRGQPATFAVNGVIKGWQEALVRMKPGAHWELYIPPDLAYAKNSPPPIPPNSLLKFDVELLKVEPASATSPPAGGTTPRPGGAVVGGASPGSGANSSSTPH